MCFSHCGILAVEKLRLSTFFSILFFVMPMYVVYIYAGTGAHLAIFKHRYFLQSLLVPSVPPSSFQQTRLQIVTSRKGRAGFYPFKPTIMLRSFSCSGYSSQAARAGRGSQLASMRELEEDNDQVWSISLLQNCRHTNLPLKS
jgi:hypothetical protein